MSVIIEGCALEDVGECDVCLHSKKYVKCPFLSFLAHNLEAIRITFLDESMKTQGSQCTHSKDRMIGAPNSVIPKPGGFSLVAITLSSPSRTKSRAGKRFRRVEKRFAFRFPAAATRYTRGLVWKREVACDANSGTDNFEEHEATSLPRATPCIGIPYVEKNEGGVEGGIEGEEQSIRCVKELDPATPRDISMEIRNDDEPLLSETDNPGATSQNGATAVLISQWDDLRELEVEDISFEVTYLFLDTEVRSELTDLHIQEHDNAQMICQLMGDDETVREDMNGSRSEDGRIKSMMKVRPDEHSGDLIVETYISEEKKDAVRGGETLFYSVIKPVSEKPIKVGAIFRSRREDGRIKFMQIRPKHGLDHYGDLILEINISEEMKDALRGGETPFSFFTIPVLIKDSAEKSSPSKPKQVIDIWDMFPEIVQDMVLSYLPAKDLFRACLVCKKIRNLLVRSSKRRELFEETRANLVHTEGVYSPLYFTADETGWHWGGFEVAEKKWSTLPSLECLPAPDPELFKDFLVAGGGGLLCVNVEKSPGDEKLIMCNPMKQQREVLPALNYRRHPVLMHVLVDKVENSYKVIVAGSSTMGTEDRALKTEVYDSRTGEWTLTGNLPLPEFGLNEYQNGAYYKDELGKGWLFCVAVLEEGGKGVIAYDIEEGNWLSNWKLRIPPVNCQACFVTTQMVECSGQVYVFSEQESGKDVWFCIHRLKVGGSMSEGAWERLLKTKRKGSRGLLVYPEFICVSSGKDELCIFNTVEHTMETYNVDRMSVPPIVHNAPVVRGKSFHSLNPLGFKFEPNFGARV